MPFFAHPFDMYGWYIVTNDMVKIGPLAKVYIFPPMWEYTVIPLAYLYHWLSTIFHIEAIPVNAIPVELNPGWNINYVPGPLFNFVIKVPLLISDVLVAFILYKVIEELTKKRIAAERTAFLWFLNPFLIWISSGWGQYDTLPTLFATASFLLLIRRKTKSSAICLAVSVLYKLYALLFLVPIFIFFLRVWKPKWRREWLKFLFVFLLFCALIESPQLWLLWSQNLLSQLWGFTSYYYTPTPFFGFFGFGLTYWTISLLVPLDVNFLTLIMDGMIMCILALTFSVIGKSKFGRVYSDLAASELSCLVALFLSFRIICEQYFVWALPFFVIVCIEGRVKSWLYGASSLIALVYAQKNFPFYLLPAYPWIGNALVQMARLVKPFSQTSQVQGWVVTMPSFSGAVILTILGAGFSLVMLLLYFRLILGLDWKYIIFKKSDNQ
jgi:Gpi18-like mannosyltransferase